VFGVRYRVLDTADGYLEEGIASWYGGEFHGRPTSSGEIFDQNRVSAAHRTLPLHTWVEVENLENGRQIVVRVNDRGPFAHTDTRIIDLSRAAADELGYLPSGTARVRVRAVDPPSGDDSAP
jgi:rare lipoprotein A